MRLFPLILVLLATSTSAEPMRFKAFAMVESLWLRLHSGNRRDHHEHASRVERYLASEKFPGAVRLARRVGALLVVSSWRNNSSARHLYGSRFKPTIG